LHDGGGLRGMPRLGAFEQLQQDVRKPAESLQKMHIPQVYAHFFSS